MIQIERIGVEALIPYARNSRTHSDAQVAQIAASIREFGFTNPVLVDEANGIIAAYVDVAVKRWQEFTGQAATLEGDGRSFADMATERCKADA